MFNIRSTATLSLGSTLVAASLLFVVIYFVTIGASQEWIPQALVTLAGLVGASWFIGHRLDLYNKDISQRHTASSRANLNDAVEKAVEMLSDDNTVTVLSGQRWLHNMAKVGPEESELVQSLLCNYIANVPKAEPSPSEFNQLVKLRQAAFNLLFSRDNNPYTSVTAVPELSLTSWEKLNFTGYDFRGANLYGANFKNAVVNDCSFDKCNLNDTEWSKVGGNLQTSMHAATLCGAKASSVKFDNVDLTEADLTTSNRQTHFRSCEFIECDFTRSIWRKAKFEHCVFDQCNFDSADWSGALLIEPNFKKCTALTYELCSMAQLKKPNGLGEDVLKKLRENDLLEDS